MAPQTMYRTISEQVAERIRYDINSGELKEDSLLREQELSDKFGVSRGTVRHALMQLTVEGLVIATPNIGMRVASHPTPEALELIIEVRLRIESQVLRAVWTNLRGQLEEWGKILVELKVDGGAEDVPAFFDADIRFHRFVVNLYPDTHVQDLWEAARSRMMMRYARLDRLTDAYEEHRLILQAVADDDIDAALRHLKANLR